MSKSNKSSSTSSSSSSSKKVKKPPPICKGTNKKGEKCTKFSMEGRIYCISHSKDTSLLCNSPTTKGTSCKSPKGKCIFHSDYKSISKSKPQGICNATKSNGEACKGKRVIGELYCFNHIGGESENCGAEKSKGGYCTRPKANCPYHQQMHITNKNSKTTSTTTTLTTKTSSRDQNNSKKKITPVESSSDSDTDSDTDSSSE